MSRDKPVPPGRVRQWLLWFGLLTALTAAMVMGRHALDKAHVSLLYLLAVLGASAAGGRALGFAVSAAAFVAFNYFFLPPVGTLTIAHPLDLLILATFLVTSLVAAQLLYRANRLSERAARAESDRRVEALRNALLMSVSHDLRTPLTSIKGIAHEIAEGGDPRAALEIEVAADRLNLLISDMLELSRIQAGASRPSTTVETIDDLVGAALQQARSVLRDRFVAIDGTEEMLSGRFVFTDALRVLVNLLENAGKYSPDGQPIDLRIRRDGDMITLAVMDHGPGVPVEDRERIFEPFYRARGTPANRWGTGLGLSIARGLAEAQGGALRYADREGGGAVFTFAVPAVPPGEPSAET